MFRVFLRKFTRGFLPKYFKVLQWFFRKNLSKNQLKIFFRDAFDIPSRVFPDSLYIFFYKKSMNYSINAFKDSYKKSCTNSFRNYSRDCFWNSSKGSSWNHIILLLITSQILKAKCPEIDSEILFWNDLANISEISSETPLGIHWESFVWISRFCTGITLKSRSEKHFWGCISESHAKSLQSITPGML